MSEDLPVLEQHQRLLEASAINAAVARQRGYFSVTNAAALKQLGFSRSQQELVPALIIPVCGVTGEVVFHQARPDHPRGLAGKPVKYETPRGARMALDIHPLAKERLGDPDDVLIITEGVRKADAAFSQGVTSIALLGVWNWRGTNGDGGKVALADWDLVALNGREVFLCFDSDAFQKESVQAALERLQRFLKLKGASVYIIRLEPGPEGAKVGLDDFLGAGGDLSELLGKARHEAPTITAETEHFALGVLTARALCALPDPPESDELLGPLVVRGNRLVLGGHTGEGKTTLALQLVRAIVLGEELLDWASAGGVRALVIDAEQGLKTIKRRLREAGLADPELVDYVRVPDGLELDSNERHIAEVERLLSAGDYGVVVADPLYKLHAGDSNAEREAVDLMRRWDAWREQLRFAFLLPVHCRKPVPGLRFSIHDLFGSSAYVRGAEVVLGLQRVRNGYAKLHWLKDRDGDLPIGTKWGLVFDREQGFRRDPDDDKPSTREQLAELRAADPTITQVAAAEAIGVSERTIRKYWNESSGPQMELGEDEATGR